MKASRSGNIQRFLGRYMSVGGSLTLGLLCSLGAVEARAQSQSTNPTLPSTLICYPGFDAKCSPKIVSGVTKPSANPSFGQVILNKAGSGGNFPGSLVLNFPQTASGFCGVERNQPACPEKLYEVPIEFKADTASVTINARGTSVGQSSDPGQACGQIFLDVFKKEGSNETKVSSQFLGQACDAQFQTQVYSYTAIGLEVGKNYVIRGRTACYYGAIPASGFFRCNAGVVDVQIVSPFGTYTVPAAR